MSKPQHQVSSSPTTRQTSHHSRIILLIVTLFLYIGESCGREDDQPKIKSSGTRSTTTKKITETKTKTKNKKKPSRPHIWMIVVDDLGSNDLGFHGSGIHTPNIDSLVMGDDNKDGYNSSSSSSSILLDQYYVLPCCSPTRASLLSGKYPLHHGIHSYIEDYSTVGLPLDNVETLPNMLKRSKADDGGGGGGGSGGGGGENNKNQEGGAADDGYETHAVGKWHLGHAKWEYTPTFRGFDSFFGFYRGGEDYYTHSAKNAYDMRYDKQPMCGRNCSKIVDRSGNQRDEKNAGTRDELGFGKEQYSTHVFTKQAIRVVEDYGNRKHTLQDHDERHPSNETDPTESKNGTLPPLFLYLAFQAVHAPDQVPWPYKDRYSDRADWSDTRKTYAGMLTAADEGIGNITKVLQKDYPDIWDNLLIVFTTDNGGPTEICAVQGSSNHPKRGGKCTVWEGGTTGDGFVSGPYMTKLLEDENEGEVGNSNRDKTTSLSDAESSKGQSHDSTPVHSMRHYSHLFHVVDWLPTLAQIVGVKPRDGLDGKGQLSGWQHDIPIRDHVHIGYAFAAFSTKQWYGPAIRSQQWKLIQGSSGGPDENNLKPKGSDEPLPGGGSIDGGQSESASVNNNNNNNTSFENESNYLLFDLENDPNEQHNVASQFPEIVESLVDKLREYQKTYLPPQPEDPSCPFTGFVNTSMGPTWMPWCNEVVLYS
ncbi:unnamed protein product [Cylindrotheca closterium]|uniref:Sulfatase N-terminal domain-containing protein n=1 Tax=Cylindrotheca closterium TaxID=2856 RepID=A0AAD2FEV1_9STRA|nr:unnamed protein product [Cylindrotheca closterium]